MIRSSINYLQNEIQRSNFEFGGQLIINANVRTVNFCKKQNNFRTFFCDTEKELANGIVKTGYVRLLSDSRSLLLLLYESDSKKLFFGDLATE